MKISSPTHFMAVAILAILASTPLRAAQVDIGITLGSVVGASGTILDDAKVELGVFSSYTDAQGLSFFTGKSYATLRSSFTLLQNLDNSTVTDTFGNYYGAYDTATTASGTRLFAWIFDTNDSATATSWAVISGGGTGANSAVYNPVWLSVAPAAVENNIIEAATLYSVIYASTPGAAILANTTIDPEGADIALVPEPSTGTLMMLGAAGLVALRRLRKV